MSYKTQKIHMSKLADLVTQDLRYISGEKESGPNGAKKVYLRTGKTFLRALAKDLGFMESEVYTTPGGIGVSGGICMMGMWRPGNGIHVYIHQNDFTGCIMYRRISHLKDYSGDYNRHLTRGALLYSYENLLEKFLELKREDDLYAKAG